MRRLALWTTLVAVACTEQSTAPGDCPDFCPGGQIVLRDTIFTSIIERDSAFRGYLEAHRGSAMAAADVPGVQSRPYLVFDTVFTRVRSTATDTTTVPITVDSSRLRVKIVRQDRAATNVRLQLLALPLTVDSLSTFADLSGPVVDSVNLSDLLARPFTSDTATRRMWGDSIRTDSAGHVLKVVSPTDSTLELHFWLDTLQAPFNPDSGRLAFGIRVLADSGVSIGFGANESGTHGPLLVRFFHYTPKDSVTAKSDSVGRVPRFDSFAYDPPSAPVDSNLVVGGTPSARSLIRVAMPGFLHDSLDVVRATLILVPTGPVPGVASDSFRILVRPVLTDLGAKSPLSPEVTGDARIDPGMTDTLRIEVTDMVRTWAVDTSVATAFVLGHTPEAVSFTEIRFFSSRTPAFRPALHVTYVKRFPFGEP